jgi:CRP-like cAMP-binding protein/SAM-dependent methyltransferase
MPVASKTEVKPWSSDQELIAQVLTHAKEENFPAGESVLTPEGETEVFYYIRRGTVEVSYIGARQTKITVALIGAGEFFGEIGYFDNGSRVRTILASEDVEISTFDQEVMDSLRDSEPVIFVDFILYLTKRICNKFRRIAGESAPIAAYADSLASRRSCKYTEAKTLPPALVNSELWRFVHAQVEGATMHLFDLSHAIQADSSKGVSDPEKKEQCFAILTALVDTMPLLEEKISGSGYEEVLWGYIFKELYPYLMRSYYVERSYHKPKGYAGDFLIIEHVYNRVPKGDGQLGELIDEFCMNRPASSALRGRRELMANQLKIISAPLAEKGERIAIMNLACGPNRELFDFLEQCEYSELIDALCVDIDSEALQYTNKNVNTFSHLASVRLMSENVIKWSLGRVKHQVGLQDIIYSVGLCDYLDDRLFKALIKQCYNHLKPGGTLILGNYAPHEDAVFMDRILRWELIYRTREELKQLFDDIPFASVEVVSEDEDINLFAFAVKGVDA